MENEEKQKDEISIYQNPYQSEIKEASEALDTLVNEQPEKFNNLREFFGLGIQLFVKKLIHQISISPFFKQNFSPSCLI